MVVLSLGIRLSDEMVLRTENKKMDIKNTRAKKRAEILFVRWCMALFCMALFIFPSYSSVILSKLSVKSDKIPLLMKENII
jgi:uncharacterized membrane protein SpoIIM required for sporulation